MSIQSDSHTVIDAATVNVPKTITYDTEDNTHDGDKIVATNQFQNAEGDVTYFSRADHFANYEEATAAPSDFSMSDKIKSEYTNNGNYDPAEHNDDSDEMPTTGAKNGEPDVPTPIWKTITYVVWGVTAVLVIGLEFLTIQKYLKRRKQATVSIAAPAADAPAQA